MINVLITIKIQSTSIKVNEHPATTKTRHNYTVRIRTLVFSCDLKTSQIINTMNKMLVELRSSHPYDAM